jgi:hypothetical protein
LSAGARHETFGGCTDCHASEWIVREQKTGSGESTLYLYRLTPHGYVPASKKPLGDLAWAYLKTRPDWRKIEKKPEYHMSAYLLEEPGKLVLAADGLKRTIVGSASIGRRTAIF